MTQQSKIEAKIDGRLMTFTLTASVRDGVMTPDQLAALIVAGAAVRQALVAHVTENVGLVLGPVEVRE